MPSINYAPLVEQFRAAEPDRLRAVAAGHRNARNRAIVDLTEAIRAREIRPTEFRELGALFEACFGMEEYHACKSDRSRSVTSDVFEAAGAVSTQAFQDISGQIVFSAILDANLAPEFVFKGLIPEVRTPFLQGEKIAGITSLGDIAAIVPEGEAFPIAGVSADWINTPPLQKRGRIVPVTREAIFNDRTGVLLDRCNQVGYWLGYNDELRAIDAVIDENTGAKSAMLGGHRYHRKDASIATYGDSSGTHDFDNLQATNTLLDYSDLENAELLLDSMADAGTGIITGAYRAAATQIIVTTQLLHTAKQILSSTEIRVHVGGYPTSGNLPERSSPNSLQNYTIVTSPLFAARLATDTSWFLGNIGKALRKMVAWPLETTQAPANSAEEFQRDIVAQYKAEQCDNYCTFDPRYLIKSTV